ncbi:hypothetical protein [Tumidithrix helvetica]|uniref:hypothetical protein n=1 Tax=Tumidithrix helvetica TaxID=3457545 RepID=UPI003CC6662A
MSARAGRYIEQLGGYKAFIPSPLPPDPPVIMNNVPCYIFPTTLRDIVLSITIASKQLGTKVRGKAGLYFSCKGCVR